jgi:hypothetical protein
VSDEYVTVAEVAARLKLTPKTVRNHMYDGTWRRGEHWFARAGIGPRFRWTALVVWLKDPAPPRLPAELGAAFASDLPPARRGPPRRRTSPLDL